MCAFLAAGASRARRNYRVIAGPALARASGCLAPASGSPPSVASPSRNLCRSGVHSWRTQFVSLTGDSRCTITIEAMDALSEVLRIISLDSAIYFNAELSEPWCFVSPEAHTLAPVFVRGARHVIIFH